MKKGFVFGCILLAVLTTWAYRAEAAAPWMLMFHGRLLHERVVMTDEQENQKLVLSINEETSISDSDLQDRPYIEMAYFWGPEWMHYVPDGKPLDKLEPGNGNQHGRFYPAYGGAEAVVTLDNVPGSGPSKRRIKPDGLKVLAKYQIPTRLEKTPVP